MEETTHSKTLRVPEVIFEPTEDQLAALSNRVVVQPGQLPVPAEMHTARISFTIVSEADVVPPPPMPSRWKPWMSTSAWLLVGMMVSALTLSALNSHYDYYTPNNGWRHFESTLMR